MSSINYNDDIKIDLKETHVIFNNDHSNLNNLDYEHSGHTGFASEENLQDVKSKSAHYIEVEQITSEGIPYTKLTLKNTDNEEVSNATIPASKGIQDVQLDSINRKLIFRFYDTDTLECDFDELFFNSQIKNEFDNSENTVYSTQYVNSNFAQINYLSNLWCEKVSNTQVNLVKEKPIADINNYIEKTNDNSEYEWNNPEFVAIKELTSDIILTRESSFVCTLQFNLNANANLSFGAIVCHSEDGNDWTAISSQQVFSSQDYTGSGTQVIGYTENLTIYTDMLEETTVFKKNTYLGVFIYKKILNATDPTIRYYFGVNINNNDINSYVKFNFQSIRLDGSELEDNSVTYDKLGDDVKNHFLDKVTYSTSGRTRLYAVNGQQQVMMGVSSTPEDGAIVQYTGDGNVKTAIPTEDTHSANKKYVDDNLDTKLDKVTTTGNNRVYAVTSNGEQQMKNYTSIPVISAIATFSVNATLKTSTPIADNDCANKQYVDNAIAQSRPSLYQHRITFELGGVSGPPDEQIFIWLVDDNPNAYNINTFKDKYCTIDAWETQKIINGSKQLPMVRFISEIQVIAGIRLKTTGSTNNINLYLGGSAVVNRTHDLNDLNIIDSVVEL